MMEACMGLRKKRRQVVKTEGVGGGPNKNSKAEENVEGHRGGK